jgi:nucleotide-binding universal stress UspA family protein
VGPHRGHSVGARWTGTTAERIVRSADVPCLVVTGPLTLPLRHVGVAIDFAPSSRGAAVLAGDWLPAMGAADEPPTLSLVHVASSGRTAAQARLREEVERVSAGTLGTPSLAGIRVEGALPSGTAVGPTLAEWARASEVDLLVTSTEARRGWRRVWRGSQATSLTLRAACPVLLVPPSMWRRSPIVLSTAAVAVDRDGSGAAAWAWVDQMRAGATAPVEVVALPPDGDLLREAREHAADLLVVHEPRMKAYERMRAGLRSLLEHTPIPTLVLRDLPDVPIRRILVAVDTGDIWYEKLGWAKRIADRFDAPVTIYHAIDLSVSGRVRREPGGEFVSGSSAWLHDGVEEEIVPAMRTWLWERARLAGLDLDRVDVRVGLQAPWFAISTVARKIGADLVIVAAHAERRAGRVRLSRVARATLERGTYSALVVVDRARRTAEWGDPTQRPARREGPAERR